MHGTHSFAQQVIQKISERLKARFFIANIPVALS